MKNRFKLIALIAVTILLSAINSSAQDLKLGAALKSSTTGIGGDVVLQFHERMTARVGFDQMSYSYPFEFKEQGIDFSADASIKTGTILALYDFYLAKYVFASAGLGWNNFNINANGGAKSDMPYGDITVPKEKVGSFDFNIKPSLRLSPYIGIGFGRTLSIDKLVGFAFELGTFYQGGPDFTINSTGLVAPTSNPVHGQEALFENQLSQYSLYPVLKLNLSFKIVSF
jgi:hypothetical protein